MNEQALIIDGQEPAGIATLPEQHPANDLRHAMMTLPVERQNVMLAEYKARRDNFRVWLMQQMEQGVHYGVPPGCEPKGNVRPDQWQAQPSLYAAGADLLCDLLGLRAEFACDLEAWQQFGSRPGYIVVVCKLFSRANGDCIGEGRGARKEGQKGGDANNAIKMAQKSAKVDAILNGYGLRDVFTQDLETPSQPLHDNPEPNGASPTEQPRGKRQPAKTEVSADQLGHVTSHWKSSHPQQDGDVQAQRKRLYAWAVSVTKRDFDPSKLANWTLADYQKCCAALSIPTLEELGG
jgi:hypothetical protein